MSKTELIMLIEGVLERLDALRGSIPGPESLQIDQLRDQLSSQQLRLAQEQFDANTAVFRDATTRLTVVNANLKATIHQIDKIVDTIENVTRFVSAVDDISALLSTKLSALPGRPTKIKKPS